MSSEEHLHADGIREGIDTPPPIYFTIFLVGVVIWALAFSGYYLFSGWSSNAEFAEKMAAHQQRVAGEPLPGGGQ